MAVIEDELQRLWQLLAELSSQLTQNREQSELLKKQAEDLKTQAIHTGTGYALKRFNVDLSQEQFESEVERMNAQLVIENQTLQHENRQLAVLLKDHENTLEQIMARFRSHAHSTQQHELELVKYYESVIQSVLERQGQRSPGQAQRFSELDPDSFQVIQSISGLIQKAIRELSGEEPEAEDTAHPQESSSSSDRTASEPEPPPPGCGLAPGVRFEDPFKNLGQTAEARRKSTSVIEYRPRMRDPSSGGYVGRRKGSLSDYALLSAIESERLRRENDYLREMLGIAQDCSLEPTPPTAALSRRRHHHHHHTEVVDQVIKEEEDEPAALSDEEADSRFLTYQNNPYSQWTQNLRNHHGSDLIP